VTSNGGHEVTRAAFEVMLALGAGAAHGYGVMQYVERLTDGAEIIPAGTLYRTLARLVADGWVEETGSINPDAPHDARRRYYRLTELGRSVAAEEAKQMDRLVAGAREAGLLVEGDE
jgi:DNA-binding PadR family transcriptional regulator